MSRFRSKPAEIEAWPVDELLAAFKGDWPTVPLAVAEAYETGAIRAITSDAFTVTTTHGEAAIARAGDWLIPDSTPGTFYPCKPDVFAAKYEPADVGPSVNVRIKVDGAVAALEALPKYVIVEQPTDGLKPPAGPVLHLAVKVDDLAAILESGASG